MRTRNLAFLIFGVALTLSSCFKPDELVPEIGFEYFPMEVGKWSEFNVDSVWRDDVIGPIGSGSRNYELYELNESAFQDQENRSSIRIERYWREIGTEEWGIKDVWSKARTGLIAEQNEENVVFWKHNYPIEEGKEWLGNQRTEPGSIELWLGQSPIPDDWLYTYQNVHQPYTVGALSFDSTVTVLQIDRPAAFGLNLFSQEVYAKHVGLIHRQITVYDIQQDADNPVLKDTVGFTFEQRITDYGE